MFMSQAAQVLDERYSPEYVRLSLAAAMTLGLAEGRFYRNARLGCINLLLTYASGCKANCSFCGLARENPHRNNPKFEKFIRVAWASQPLDEVIERCANAPDWVERVCISQITHPRAQSDTLEICRAGACAHTASGEPLDRAHAPKSRDDILDMKEAGADRIGVAIDAATPELFDKLRGKPAKGPHRWEHYWDIFDQALEIFGQDMVGVHLIHGLGETEEELVKAIDRARAAGGSTHLFCFFPEKFSALGDKPQPAPSGYRRIQLARWLIDHDQVRAADMSFDDQGRLRDFGVDADTLEVAIALGKPFMTSGCPGASGEVACNRPFGNEKPGPDLRNYPFMLNDEDLALVREQLVTY
jgi:biotin synthase-related radical SAM superfamily protein